ncbi:hypothetical protein T265_07826 [Opisthorchis viverrini]|uniref:Uncharacterized protein n=1 Tax=Opisthorchis viverrini TaxID=6198 RepID=A0A075AAB0_OPIVI|nr:hypothetical protein T265_07826 [Opisthorchis viverrini]KER24509.1 hypothetical protein T265_07826 [Opisthorchis viverrini]
MRPTCVGGVAVAHSPRMSHIWGSNPDTAIGYALLMSSTKSETRVRAPLWCGLTGIITPEQEDDRSNESGVTMNNRILSRATKTIAPFRCLAAMPQEGVTRAGILPGCSSLDKGSQEAEVGFEPRTFLSDRQWQLKAARDRRIMLVHKLIILECKWDNQRCFVTLVLQKRTIKPATECAAQGRLMFQLLRNARYRDTCIDVMHY